jgi:hypothetical protein
MQPVRHRTTMEETVSANWLTILSLWRAGNDSEQIAKLIGLPEYAIYNFFICRRGRR